MKGHVLIFGATGSLGSSIYNSLLEQGFDIYTAGSGSGIEPSKHLQLSYENSPSTSSFEAIPPLDAVIWAHGLNFSDSINNFEVFNLNSKKELFQVSFNNYDRAPFRFEKDLTIKFYEAIKKFDLMVNDKEYQWKHILKPGELLIFNNWRILHGRSSFYGTRKISGCYINKEDFDSSCKMNDIY